MYVPHCVQTVLKTVVFHYETGDTLQEDPVPVPVERRVTAVSLDSIPAECESVHRLGIEHRPVKRHELVVLDHYTAVEILLLSLEIRNFRINRNGGVGELVHAGERIDKSVVPYQDIPAGPCLEPPVAIPAQQIAVPDVWSNRLFSTTARHGK